MIFESEDVKMKTLKNKVAAVLIMAIGCLPLMLFQGQEMDITYLLFFAMICIPMFFDRESWFYEPEQDDMSEDFEVCEWEED